MTCFGSESRFSRAAKTSVGSLCTAIRQFGAVFLTYAPTDLTSIQEQYTGGHSHRRCSPIVAQLQLDFFPHHPFNTDKLCVISLSVEQLTPAV